MSPVGYVKTDPLEQKHLQKTFFSKKPAYSSNKCTGWKWVVHPFFSITSAILLHKVQGGSRQIGRMTTPLRLLRDVAGLALAGVALDILKCFIMFLWETLAL